MSSILNEKETVLRAILLHEFKLHGNAAKATKNITDAWGKGVISERQVDRWFSKFRSNNLSLEIEKGRGRSSLIDDEALKELVESDTRQTTRELAVHMGVAKNTISRHLNLSTVKTNSFFAHGINELPSRWQRCIDSNGGYFD